MKDMSRLEKEIEMLRKKLDAAAGKSIWGPECYQLSIQMDKLIEDYMQCEEEIQLLNCG